MFLQDFFNFFNLLSLRCPFTLLDEFLLKKEGHILVLR